jgi:hypothetical protein
VPMGGGGGGGGGGGLGLIDTDSAAAAAVADRAGAGRKVVKRGARDEDNEWGDEELGDDLLPGM